MAGLKRQRSLYAGVCRVGGVGLARREHGGGGTEQSDDHCQMVPRVWIVAEIELVPDLTSQNLRNTAGGSNLPEMVESPGSALSSDSYHGQV